ncbi:hypothetical protein RvY_01081 [Ramazzottius varieornatus]|uniref:Uncharacterized protein n=1 Tax=Ramazzottius varieornatus TaxID=947166 RepID=A0A1D1UFZ3_RAMVA|nr:hypothetical protein RvY_01081 [Ramazzottius varieornatus]
MDILLSLTFLIVAVIFSEVVAIPGLIDLGQSLSDTAKYPKVQGYFRIEANIIRLENPRGTTKNWFPCDLIPGSCDPKITAAIDYQTPNNDAGKDSVPYSRYALIFEGKGSSVDINKILSKDVCGHSTRKVNVRIRAMDNDVLSDDTIDRWSCFIFTTDPPAADEQSAKWSEEKVCSGHNGSHKIIWKYRWFFIPQDQCRETAGSSGVIRRLIPFIGK